MQQYNVVKLRRRQVVRENVDTLHPDHGQLTICISSKSSLWTMISFFHFIMTYRDTKIFFLALLLLAAVHVAISSQFEAFDTLFDETRKEMDSMQTLLGIL